MKYQKSMPVSIFLGFLIFFSACATPGHYKNVSEGQWTPLQKGRGNGVEIFVDEGSIQHVSATMARLRIRYRYSSPKPFDSGYIEELVVYNEYDCRNKETYKILWSEAHFVDGGSKMDSSGRLGYILPEDVVFRYVCK
jgi:hypothetical protein